jgi:hypothetical protein
MQEVKKAKKENAEFMCKEIEHVIKTFGKRKPGSEAECQAGLYMAEQLKKYSDDVKVEYFKVNPGSFYGWITISVTMMLIAFAAYFFVPIATMVLFAIALFIMLAQFIFYRQLIDKLFPEKQSINVTAVKKPKGEVKARVFLNGHPDAADEWTVNYKWGGKGFMAHVLSAFVGIAYFFVITVVALIMNGAGVAVASGVTLWLGVAGFVFIPIFISMYWLTNTKVTVDGANDNLSACYLAISMLKSMKEKGVELQNTEVGVIISGSEEAGLRGAKAWSKVHKDDYKDVPTVIISFDTIRDTKYLYVNTRDLNSTVKADEEVAKLYKKAADNVGVNCQFGVVPFGATDSAAFTQGGFRSIGITAMDHNLQDYYHTRRDTYDNLSADALADTFEATAEFIDLVEKGELK